MHVGQYRVTLYHYMVEADHTAPVSSRDTSTSLYRHHDNTSDRCIECDQLMEKGGTLRWQQ
jgi:hypothetical protein